MSLRGRGMRQKHNQRGVTVLEGRCLSYGGAIPYVPVLDLLRAACGIAETDTPEEITARVHARLDELGLGGDDREAYLRHLLGVKLEGDPFAALGPEAIMARTFDALRELTIQMSRRAPLVLFVEDLHWIDQTSQAYLASLVERLAAVPVMLLATYRPGYRPPWLDRSYATQLALRPLGPQDSLAIVSALLPEAAPAGTLTSRILDKAEGNPFFLEELARVMTDQGGARAAIEVPDTVHGVLTARIDRLAERPK